MAWKGERWSDVVARANTAGPRRARALTGREDPDALAERARLWPLVRAEIFVRDGGVRLGVGMDAVDVAFAQLYHVEPVDPWPTLAVGWVLGGESCRAVLTPLPSQAEDFAARIEGLVEVCEREVPRAAHRGWLEFPEQPWELVDALPGEVEEGPRMRGYRMAPSAPDPVLATREIAVGGSRLLGWLAAKLSPTPRRVDPRTIIVTERFVYVRDAAGRRLRVPASSLRASRENGLGDTVFVFGRRTELLVVYERDCEVTPLLLGRVALRA